MGLGLLVDGQWVSRREQSDQKGNFIRPQTTFRNEITADGSSGFKAEAGRYHLYISWACPWAHRTAILRKLKGLESAISLSVVDPEIDQNGWEFSESPGCIPDTVNQADYLWQLYLKADPNYSGRVTVPVLWDKKTHTIVNNESREIICILDTEFERFAERQVSFYPEELQDIINSTMDTIYQPINNGVYRAGFATTQEAYEQGLTELFEALDHWDQVLEQQPYLCGDRITQADWCFFTTLLRFDMVYYGHFKCNLHPITDYKNLWNYLKELYQVPGVAETCNFDHIKRHYYRSHTDINPTKIVPKGPILDFEAPYDRNVLMH
ncbi:MAG: glutathione S-transferase family protein [Roseofilum sp. SBFL]|uniref:glutathione S-transferase family protein n=1 Tax=unclassified Roseofilum TaxID=2620099 RepID=UPI001B2D5F4C|nr:MULTISPECIES: glutathione S-transferase family protein [unclassified Roseofilum]MBP0014526.1 glutathione S-transferase family protein [Roseofilum sp. SID3]MBP0024391.1 glutathione S-transferase family protein [Roseofilum sp. SID2]MBP0037763.1 glutathione S-transferase family protein [Roseofilum sp. SID1]MBP0040569.1 glutathione S-transferase family protein [Roseofilum sp. SBFL]